MIIPASIFSTELPYKTDQQFSWPVSPNEIEEVKKKLEGGLIRVANAIDDPRIKNIFLVSYKNIFIEYLSLLQGCLIIDRCKKKGDDLLLTHHYPLFSGLWEEGVPACNQVLSSKFDSAASENKVVQASRNTLKRFKWQFKLIGGRGLFPSSFCSRNTVTVLAHNSLLQSVLKASGRPVYFVSIEELIPKAETRITLKLDGELQAISGNLKSFFSALLKETGWIVNKKLDAYILTLTSHILNYAALTYIHVEKKWAKKCPQTLWTGSGGSFFEKIARAIVREKGGEITGFDHGGPAVVVSKGFHFSLGLFAHRFVTFTEATAGLYKKFSPFWPFGLPSVEIEGYLPYRGKGQEEMAVQENKNPSPKKAKKILYIGKSFRGEVQVSVYTLLDDYVYLDWKARLVQAIHGAGFDVLVKPHPEGLLAGKNFEYSDCCQFIQGKQRVEDIWGDADAFVFDTIGSAFWNALSTRKPITWIDFGQYRWDEEAYHLVKKRCRIVNAFFDRNNRVQVDFDKVVECIKRPLPAISISFSQKYITGD